MIKNLKIPKPAALAVCSVLLILIVCGAAWFFAAHSDESQPVLADPVQQQAQAENSKFAEHELREMVERVAKERFGEDAFIIFLSSEGPTNLEIQGIKRTIYIYACDSRSEHDKTGEIRGLYHVDANTGEIFDNGTGNMEKISTGE